MAISSLATFCLLEPWVGEIGKSLGFHVPADRLVPVLRRPVPLASILTACQIHVENGTVLMPLWGPPSQ